MFRATMQKADATVYLSRHWQFYRWRIL